MSEDYYNLLGVEKNATDSEIKKAFRKKAQEYHPDKPSGDEKKFKAVNEAYSVLSDKQKRQQYDTFGSAGGPGAGAGGFGGFDFSGFQQAGGFGGGAGGFEFDLGDIFSQFGGGGRSRTRRGQDISVTTTISFKEAVFGVEKEFTLTKNSACEACDGTGAENKKTHTCPECNGSGHITAVQQTIMGQIQTNRVCHVCHGSGQVPEKNCSVCKGDGVVRGTETVKVKIPAGIEDGQQLRLSGRGEAISGGQSGDLYILVRVTPESGFAQQGKDIFMQTAISLSDAALGGTKEIETLDGKVTIKIPAGSTTGKQLRVKDKGVPITEKRRGDLYVELVIDVPQKLSRDQKKQLEQLRESGL